MRWMVIGMCALALGLAGCGGSGDEGDGSTAEVGLKSDRAYVGEPLEAKISAKIGTQLVANENSYEENPFRALPCFEYSNRDAEKWKGICDVKPKYGPEIRCLVAEPLGHPFRMETSCESHPDEPGWEKACFAKLNRYLCTIFAARGTEDCELTPGAERPLLMCTGVGLASRNFTSPRGRERW